MAGNLELDTSEFDARLKELEKRTQDQNKKALSDVSSEILRLSSFEVPHDTGMLQNSGGIEVMSDYAIVGYNKVYAARLHEHPEYKFKKGRKGKYLEDPIKNNIDVLREFFQTSMSQAFT